MMFSTLLLVFGLLSYVDSNSGFSTTPTTWDAEGNMTPEVEHDYLSCHCEGKYQQIDVSREKRQLVLWWFRNLDMVCSETFHNKSPEFRCEFFKTCDFCKFVSSECKKNRPQKFHCVVEEEYAEKGEHSPRLAYISALDIAKPQIKPFHFSGDLKPGKRVSVLCSVIDGDPPFNFKWFKDGEPLLEGNDVSVRTLDDFNSNLAFSKLGPENNGNYSCVVSNAVGTDEKNDILDISANLRRRRNLDTCSMPAQLKTFDTFCVHRSTYMECTQRCVFGHTLPEGITRKMKCYYSKNVWKPAGFQECSPFIDCTVTLVDAGHISCTKPTVFKSTYCNISCYEYPFSKGSPTERYDCENSGGYNKKLPHCVVAGSGIILAKEPKIKYHVADDEKGRK